MFDIKNFRDSLKYGYTLIEFGGDSCANCITMMPILQEIVSENPELTLFNIQVNQQTQEMVDYYNVRTAPCVILLYNDQLLGMVNGLQPKEILEIWIESKILEHKK